MTSQVDNFLTYLEHSRGRSAGTVAKYSGHLLRLNKWLVARSSTLENAGRADVEEFCGIHAHRMGLTPRSRRPLIAAVRGFYEWLRRSGKISESPAEDLNYPAAGRPLPTQTTLNNAEKLLMMPDVGTLQGLRDASILALFIGCGVRLSGLCALNESNLQRLDVDGQEWLILRALEKGKKERLIPVPHEARLLLHAYLGHPELESIDRTLPDGGRVLFVSLRNRTIPVHEYFGERRRLAPRSIQDLMARYGARAGIPRAQLHPHALRHLYGTELAEADVHLLRMQSLLGHVNPKDTEIYTHLAVRTLIREVARANPLRKIKTPVSELLRELEARRIS